MDEHLLGSLESLLDMERLYIPQVSTECRMMTGETAEDQAVNLVKTLREQKII